MCANALFENASFENFIHFFLFQIQKKYFTLQIKIISDFTQKTMFMYVLGSEIKILTVET